jgi:FMN reductase
MVSAAVIVGNPKLASRTRDAAERLAASLGAQPIVIEVAGLLKLFLDQFATDMGLAGQVGIPLMLGGGPAHALAPEMTLKPVLVELGAICPAQGLYQLDSSYAEDDSLASWIGQWGPAVLACTRKG